jgi:hypothetical protein
LEGAASKPLPKGIPHCPQVKFIIKCKAIFGLFFIMLGIVSGLQIGFKES